MTIATRIDRKETIISTRDDSVEALTFERNKQIFVLPENVNKAFSNLWAYDASFCSVQEICHNNFDGLTNLHYLKLDENQIEKIFSDTFEDLKMLEFLSLSMSIK
jgi:Leucine rich repeat